MKFCLYKKKCEFCENIVINNFEIDMYSLVFSGTELQKLTTQYERRSLGLNREELISQIESCCLHDILEGIYQFHINFPFKIQTKLDNSLIINFSFIPLYQDVKRK